MLCSSQSTPSRGSVYVSRPKCMYGDSLTARRTHWRCCASEKSAMFRPSFMAGLKIWEVGVDPEKGGLFLYPGNRDTKVILIDMEAEEVGSNG